VAPSVCARCIYKAGKMAPGNPVTPSLLSCLAGLRQCRAGVAFGLGRWGFECGEDDGGTLDDLQALGQKCGVAVIQVDVIGGCPAGIQTDGGSDDERNRLGFGLVE